MEYAIVLLIGIVVGYMGGRQATRDKQNLELGRPVESALYIPSIAKKKTKEEKLFEEGLDNILTYEGENQHDA